MERMDRARRVGGLLWVAVGLVFGLGWAVLGRVVPGTITLAISTVVVVLACLVMAGARSALAGRVVAVLLAAQFAGAVADRFGAFGPPGAPGVSWGSWRAFVDYTGLLLHGAPRAAVVGGAALATVLEVALAVALLSGWQRRWIGKATAGLLFCYLVAMAASVGWGEVARYGLPFQVGGALLVTVSGRARGAGQSADVRRARPFARKKRSIAAEASGPVGSV
ncbi:MAG: hypothetical protein QOH17_25 [Pseudonocardiales bacterium]|nr:hypothetical protein [Pseudonocardiales bacterium]